MTSAVAAHVSAPRIGADEYYEMYKQERRRAPQNARADLETAAASAYRGERRRSRNRSHSPSSGTHLLSQESKKPRNRSCSPNRLVSAVNTNKEKLLGLRRRMKNRGETSNKAPSAASRRARSYSPTRNGTSGESPSTLRRRVKSKSTSDHSRRSSSATRRPRSMSNMSHDYADPVISTKTRNSDASRPKSLSSMNHSSMGAEIPRKKRSSSSTSSTELSTMEFSVDPDNTNADLCKSKESFTTGRPKSLSSMNHSNMDAGVISKPKSSSAPRRPRSLSSMEVSKKTRNKSHSPTRAITQAKARARSYSPTGNSRNGNPSTGNSSSPRRRVKSKSSSLEDRRNPYTSSNTRKPRSFSRGSSGSSSNTRRASRNNSWSPTRSTTQATRKKTRNRSHSPTRSSTEYGTDTTIGTTTTEETHKSDSLRRRLKKQPRASPTNIDARPPTKTSTTPVDDNPPADDMESAIIDSLMAAFDTSDEDTPSLISRSSKQSTAATRAANSVTDNSLPSRAPATKSDLETTAEASKEEKPSSLRKKSKKKSPTSTRSVKTGDDLTSTTAHSQEDKPSSLRRRKKKHRTSGESSSRRASRTTDALMDEEEQPSSLRKSKKKKSSSSRGDSGRVASKSPRSRPKKTKSVPRGTIPAPMLSEEEKLLSPRISKTPKSPKTTRSPKSPKDHKSPKGRSKKKCPPVRGLVSTDSTLSATTRTSNQTPKNLNLRSRMQKQSSLKKVSAYNYEPTNTATTAISTPEKPLDLRRLLQKQNSVPEVMAALDGFKSGAKEIKTRLESIDEGEKREKKEKSRKKKKEKKERSEKKEKRDSSGSKKGKTQKKKKKSTAKKKTPSIDPSIGSLTSSTVASSIASPYDFPTTMKENQRECSTTSFSTISDTLEQSRNYDLDESNHCDLDPRRHCPSDDDISITLQQENRESASFSSSFEVYAAIGGDPDTDQVEDLFIRASKDVLNIYDENDTKTQPTRRRSSIGSGDTKTQLTTEISVIDCDKLGVHFGIEDGIVCFSVVVHINVTSSNGDLDRVSTAAVNFAFAAELAFQNGEFEDTLKNTDGPISVLLAEMAPESSSHHNNDDDDDDDEDGGSLLDDSFMDASYREHLRDVNVREPPSLEKTQQSPLCVSNFPAGYPKSISAMYTDDNIPEVEPTKPRAEPRVKFDPVVRVKNTLSRRDLTPEETHNYWCGEEDFLSEEDRALVLKMLTDNWTQRKELESKQHEAATASSKLLMPILPAIQQLLPVTEQEFDDDYTYTIKIKN